MKQLTAWRSWTTLFKTLETSTSIVLVGKHKWDKGFTSLGNHRVFGGFGFGFRIWRRINGLWIGAFGDAQFAILLHAGVQMVELKDGITERDEMTNLGSVQVN